MWESFPVAVKARPQSKGLRRRHPLLSIWGARVVSKLGR